jgi:hypothetical protein
MTEPAISANMPEGIAGMLDDSSLLKDCVSKTNAESVNTIPPGCFVMQGTNDDDVKLPAGSTALLVGVAVFGHSYVPSYAVDPATGNYLPNVTFDVLKHGRIRVVSETALAPGDTLHVRHTANGGHTQLGAVTHTADTGHTLDIGAFAQVVRSGDGVTTAAVIEIDLTNVNLATAD